MWKLNDTPSYKGKVYSADKLTLYVSEYGIYLEFTDSRMLLNVSGKNCVNEGIERLEGKLKEMKSFTKSLENAISNLREIDVEKLTSSITDTSTSNQPTVDVSNTSSSVVNDNSGLPTSEELESTETQPTEVG